MIRKGVRFKISKNPWYPLILVIASKGERVPIGDFLNEEEKLELIDRIEEKAMWSKFGL